MTDRKDWEALAEKELRGRPLEDLTWNTPEGIAVKPLYTPETPRGSSTPTRCRASRPSSAGRRRRCTPAGPGRSASTPASRPPRSRNAFYRKALAAGAAGLSVAFDLATHRGYDSDHPRVTGDVGKAGVAIDSVEDMKILFDGIPLDKVSVSMTMNGAVLPVLAGYIVAAEEQGVDAGEARRDHPERHPQGVHGPQHLHLPARAVACGSSPTSSSTRRSRCRSSTRSRSPATTCRRPARTRCRSWPSRWPTARIRARGARARASTSTTSRRGCRFFCAIGMNFFMEIAKMRAARLLWAGS